MISKRTLILVALLVNTFFVLVSTPWVFGGTFFGDSLVAWVIFYLIGFALSYYVTYIFIWVLTILVNLSCEHFKEINHGGE